MAYTQMIYPTDTDETFAEESFAADMSEVVFHYHVVGDSGEWQQPGYLDRADVFGAIGNKGGAFALCVSACPYLVPDGADVPALIADNAAYAENQFARS